MDRRDFLKILATLPLVTATSQAPVDCRLGSFPAYFILLTLENPAWNAPIHLVADSFDPVLSRGNSYQPMPISIDYSGNFPRAHVVDVTGLLTPVFEKFAGQTECRWEIVSSKNLDEALATWEHLSMVSTFEVRAA